MIRTVCSISLSDSLRVCCVLVIVYRTVQQVFDARFGFIKKTLETVRTREEFDKLAAENDVPFGEMIEEDIKPTHTLEDYKKWFKVFEEDRPISFFTYETLEWVVDSPPEEHLFEEYPALKITTGAPGRDNYL